jgi:hypothetical protein
MDRKRISVFSLTLVACLAADGALAQGRTDAGTRWPVTGIEAPLTELAMELFVTIDPAVVVGESDDGTRQFIPITGGRFVGDGIRGEVMPGGADWQVVRSDGTVEVLALYSIRTDDGAVIVVDNRGIIVPPDTDSGRPPYMRTAPRFHAPQGPYEWLNSTSFVGTITPVAGGGAVVIRVFRVL